MRVNEVSTAVAAGADAETIAETVRVHPALSEVVQGAFRQVRTSHRREYSGRRLF